MKFSLLQEILLLCIAWQLFLCPLDKIQKTSQNTKKLLPKCDVA